MIGRLLHVSDLHVGRAVSSEQVTSLRELVAGLAPEILVVTGDLTHRGRHVELEQAHHLLESLGVPILAVPGNHDLPYAFPKRFTQTRAEWERTFGPTEPVYTSSRLAIAGLNSTRPWRHQGGALSSSALDRLIPLFERAAPGALRVIALHHHIASPPWRVARKRPIRDRDSVLDRLVSAGVELVLSGHVHQGSIAQRREFVNEPDQGSSMVLATVPGFGRPRPDHGAELLGFNIYEFDRERITVLTHCWATGGRFVEVGRRTFPRGLARAAADR